MLEASDEIDLNLTRVRILEVIILSPRVTRFK